jgi:deoxycytidylate deaminase
MEIKYPYLPEGRTILYVPPENEFMKAAEVARKELSTERNHPTGAVVVMNGQIVQRAGNQAPIKNPYLAELHKKWLCIRRILKIKTGTKYWMCPGCARSSYHAETLAVKNAKKKEVITEGADVYLHGHWWCCKPCWDAMIEGGIKNVYLVEGSEVLFDRTNSNNSLPRQLDAKK